MTTRIYSVRCLRYMTRNTVSMTKINFAITLNRMILLEKRGCSRNSILDPAIAVFTTVVYSDIEIISEKYLVTSYKHSHQISGTQQFRFQ